MIVVLAQALNVESNYVVFLHGCHYRFESC